MASVRDNDMGEDRVSQHTLAPPVLGPVSLFLCRVGPVWNLGVLVAEWFPRPPRGVGD